MYGGSRVTDPDAWMTVEDLQERIGKLEKERDESRKAAGAQTALAEERLAQLKYLQADFDNYRRNFEKEKVAIISLAEQYLMDELLVILDDLEQALQATGDGPGHEGLSMLHRKFFRILENHGLKRIDALGRPFDPHLHMVVSREESDRDEGTVLEECRTGYMLKSRVLRPALVKVAEQRPAKEDTYGEGEDYRD
jgi:molecular chaperone GrpE